MREFELLCFGIIGIGLGLCIVTALYYLVRAL